MSVQTAPRTQSRPSPGSVVLRTVNLSKTFGQITAVRALNLEVWAGEVLGFLGPNGSGKSTTAGMILGLIAPSAGHVELFGQARAAGTASLVRGVGAIIESPAFYPYLSGRDNLRALALATGGVATGRVDQLLRYVGLGDRAGSAYKTYSLGMKQRLGIASTLLTDPALVILDEPTNGLDPAGQREVRELIPQLAREGRAVLLASHLLNEVEHICDRVAIIRKGELVQSGTVADLLHREQFLEIEIADRQRAISVLRALPFLRDVTVDSQTGRIRVQVQGDSDGAAVNRALVEQGLYVSALMPRTSTLEDVFLELTEPAMPEAPR